MVSYSHIILGAGFYGLYAACHLARALEGTSARVLVLERDGEAFSRASFSNQARVHNGYHYPRSLATATKSAHYYRRFCEDFSFCVNGNFHQVYATGRDLSWTDAAGFRSFCDHAAIRCEELAPSTLFKSDLCDGAFLTTECTYDAALLRDYLLAETESTDTVDLRFNTIVRSIDEQDGTWVVTTDEETYRSAFILNTTYAAVNNIHALIDAEPFAIKYELCEIILCDVAGRLDDVGITVMDGPFFSIMPFGKTGYHSLTSVTFTPHQTSYDAQPAFSCQADPGANCHPHSLANCNDCPARPESAWPYMSQLARKYLRDDLEFSYRDSLFSVKPIMKASEVDDSRPTIIRTVRTDPTMVSVLSGKINTVYDLIPVLDEALV